MLAKSIPDVKKIHPYTSAALEPLQVPKSVISQGSLEEQNLQNKYMYVYIQNGLQAIVQLGQQWLFTNGRSMNPVVVQSVRLDVSAGLMPAKE